MTIYQMEVAVNGRLDHEEFPRFVNSIIGEKGLSWDGKQCHQRTETCVFDAFADMDRMGIQLKEQKESYQTNTFIALDISQRKLAIKVELVTEAGLPYIHYQAPEFIPSLLNGGYLKNDGDIPWTDKPIVIDERNIKLLTDVINNTGSSKCTTVYLSERRNGQMSVNAELLAKKVAGIAHVMVLRSHDIVQLIRKDCSRHEYNGAAGVYFPDGTRHTYLPADISEYDTAMMNRVTVKVFLWANTRPSGSSMTWQDLCSFGIRKNLREQHKRLEEMTEKLKDAEDKIQELQDRYSEEKQAFLLKAISEAKTESEKILHEFDEEMDRIQNENEQLKKDNRNLLYENKALSDRLEKQGTPLVFAGKEEEKFPGEIKDLLMCTLKDCLKLSPKGRRADIIKDLLETNGEGLSIEEKTAVVKNLFNNYSRMDSTTRKTLEDLGFSMVEDGKHIRMTYCNDARYVETLAKTPSDAHTGRNTAHHIIKMIY
jgi:hypothetical protein